MSDNISGGIRYIERGERVSAWHKLGQSFTEFITVREAAERNRIVEIEVAKYPLTVQLPGAAPLTVPNLYSLVRAPMSDDPEARILGQPVTGDYHVLQPIELADTLEGVNAKWPLETAGALGQGETIFYTFKAGERTLGGLRGEDMIDYFAVVDFLDGKHALKMLYTPVRIVCQNTLQAALGRAGDNHLRVEHTKDIQADVTWLADFFLAAERSRQEVLEAMEALTRVRLYAQQRQMIIEKAYPLPSEPKKSQLLKVLTPDDLGALMYTSMQAAVTAQQEAWEAQKAKVEEHRANALVLYALENEQSPAIAGTAYALVNAVAEYAQFRGATQTKARAASALFGERAQEQLRATKAALTLVH